MKNFIGCYNKSIILTFLGMILAITGIYFVSDHRIAMLCLIGAGICDLFDGCIARRTKRTEKEKEYGIQLDSLVDVMSFLALPVAFLLYNTKTPAGIVVSSIYMFCGITRLAWFNITTEGDGVFQGMPVTYAALFLPLVNLFFGYGNFVVFKIILCIVYILMSFLFIWNIEIKKPGKHGYITLCIMAIVIITLYIVKICIWPLY